MKQKNPAEYFKEKARKYAENERIRALQTRLTKKALSLVRWERGSKILDLGCGAGFSMEILAMNGFNVTGIDISEDMVELAKNKGLNVKVADARELPFEDESFDGILSISTLQWLDEKDMGKVAKEMFRVLKPGGIAVVQFYPRNQRHILSVGKAFLESGFEGEFEIPEQKEIKKNGVFLILKKPDHP